MLSPSINDAERISEEILKKLEGEFKHFHASVYILQNEKLKKYI
jgi:hypothetical protein